MENRKVHPILARRRFMRETVALTLAVVLAIIGQGFLGDREHGSALVGIGFFLAAVALALTVSGSLNSERASAPNLGPPRRLSQKNLVGADSSESDPRFPLDPAREAEGSDPIKGWRWPTQFRQPRLRGLAGAAVLCAVAALVIFERSSDVTRNVAWALYLSSVALGLVVAFRLDPAKARAPAHPDPPSSGGEQATARREWLLLAGILTVGAFYRLWRIDRLPWGLWYDEAAHGLDMLHILTDPAFRPIYLETIVPQQALYCYVGALFVAIFGATPFALRIHAVVAGLITIWAVYLLARELFGWRAGAVSAAFLAVSSWHVNFSRAKFDAIWSDSLNTLAAYFLIRALRSNRYRDYALAGLCLGLGLNNYYTSELLAVVFVAYLLYRLSRERLALPRRATAGLLVLAVTVALSAGPLIEFAVLHPAQYTARMAQVSVFGEMSRANSIEPLVSNLGRHLRMFNYAGDPNGRHNLSGSPQLEPVVAALFVLGLALALRRAARSEYAFPLIWLPIALAGGVFSLSFEAPQSLRTLDNVVVTALLAAIPVAALWSRLTWARLMEIRLPRSIGGPAPLSIGAVVALLLFGGAAVQGYQKYFVAMANDYRSWAEFSPGPTEIGREVAALDLSTTDVYLDPQFLGQPTIAFLAPNLKTPVEFQAAKDLPFRAHRNAVTFLASDASQTALAMQQLYPTASVRALTPPFGGPPVMYTVSLSADEIASSQGLDASYQSLASTSSKPPITMKIPNLDLNWNTTRPALDFPFRATWRGVLAIPEYGSYRLQFQGPADSQVFLDEYPILRGNEEKALTLAAGPHALRVMATLTDPTPLRLLWRTPLAGRAVPVPGEALFSAPINSRGLLGKYYPNGNWQGTPAIEQIDPSLEQRFHLTPLPRPYSVEWSGKIDLPATGAYTFGVQSIDSSWIYLDDHLIATNEGQPNGYVEGSARLSGGMHDLRVRFQDLTGFSYIKVYWRPPGLDRELIPPGRLFPPQGAYPERAGPLQPSVLKLTGGPPTPPNGRVEVLAPPSTPAAAAIGTLPPAPFELVTRVGTPGTAPGQLASPRGVATDKAGNLYVVETDTQRISVFTADGTFQRAWGSKGEGSDQFIEPVDLAVTPTDEIVVLDSTTGWLKVFTPDGTPLRQLGGPGLAAYHPRALAIDPSGEIFVADAGNARVIEMRPDGGIATKFGPRGAAAGQIAEPVGVAIGLDGSIYLTDTANNRASHYDPSFQFLQAWALPRSTSVLGPHIAALTDGSVLVSDPEGQRVIHFDPDGQPIDQIGGPGEMVRPVGVRVDRQGKIYIADAEAGSVLVYDTKRN